MTTRIAPPAMTVSQTFARAMESWSRGDRAEARRLARRLAETAPGFGGGHYLLGLIALADDRPRQAIAPLTRAVGLDPGQPAPRLALARALEAAGRPDSALPHLTAILETDPDHAEAHARLGDLRGRRGERDAAIAHCRRAIAANPVHADALNRLGGLLHETGAVAEAIAILDRVLAIDPERASAHYNRGLALNALDRPDEAARSLALAAARRPDHAPTRIALASALRRLGRLDDAGAEAALATRLAPRDPAGWLELGLVATAARAVETALAAHERAVALAPRSADARWCLAESLRAAGRTEAAAEQYRACLALDPADRHGAALGLAQVGAAPLPDRAPDAYVRQLFDEYADRFDTALVDRLGYRGPDLLGDALTRTMTGRRNLTVIDIGCGTGLAGPILRPLAARLDGIDLSPRMIEHAARRGLYDRLDVGELTALLAERPATYDLVAAADVLIYFGDLDPVMRAARRALVSGGILAATFDRHDGAGVHLGEGRRYAHAVGHVAERAEAAGFAVTRIEPAVIRREADAEVPGLVALLTAI